MTAARAPGVVFWIYVALTIFGAAVPLAEFVPWLRDHGPDARLFVNELFVNRISSFFGLDIIVSAVVLIVFIRVESAWRRIPLAWLPVVALVTIGVSCALPLCLALRERALGRG